MFEILQEWLTSKLGLTDCSNLNFGNVGEKFKDGVLFTRVLRKYRAIPDSNINNVIIKKTNFHPACLNNIKNLNLWLRFLDITIDDHIINDIACGRSLAVTKLLYQLFFKLETSKQYGLLDGKKSEENKKTNGRTIKNVCNNNNLKQNVGNQERRKYKDNLDNEIYNVLKHFYGPKGIQHTTAIDIVKSTKNKNDVLNFIQHNVECFYDLFIKILDDKLSKKPDEICKSMINTLNAEEYIMLHKRLNDINLNLKIININDENLMATKLDKYKRQIIRNDYESHDDLKNRKSKINTSKIEDYAPQSVDDQQDNNVNELKQDFFYEYLNHSGLWSFEYLNIDPPYTCKQNDLSTVIKKVLNYEEDASEIKSMNLEKSHFSGVVDLIHDTKVVKLIKDKLESKEILCFTAHEAVSACLNAYNEELKVSIDKGKLYQTLDEYNVYQTAVKKHSKNQKPKKNPGSDQIETDSINSVSELTIGELNTSTESIYIEYEKSVIKNTNKLTQTPEDIPEPDYNDPEFSSMAKLGKLIDGKTKVRCDLQIGDVINCIGEYTKRNRTKNGWILLEFPVQPLQIALLEYKMTGKIPFYGKDIMCNSNAKQKSRIVPEYNEDDENIDTPANTYLSRCIKIISSRNEIKDEKWNGFLRFYKQQQQQDRVVQVVLLSDLNNITKQPRKAANILIELILNKEIEPNKGKLFKSINIFDKNFNNDRRSESENDDNKNNIGELYYTIMIKNKTCTIANKFQLISNDFHDNEIIPNNYARSMVYLKEKWKTMEHDYEHRIKELLRTKEECFKDIATKTNLITDKINETIRFQNTGMINLILEYENESQRLLTNNGKKLEQKLFALQTSLWDELDGELERITQFIERTMKGQWIINTYNTLISTYKRLLKIEFKRAMTTLNFLNKYYCGENYEHEINEIDFCADIDDNDNIDTFKTLCSDTINEFEKYIRENDEMRREKEREEWTRSVWAEKNRFMNQVRVIKARMFLDKTQLDNLTRIDNHLEKLHAIYLFKTNDINNLCELFKRVADTGENINGQIKQMSGKFYVNELSVFEITSKQIFYLKYNFNVEQLRTITNKLLDEAPTFKMTINGLIDVLNEFSKTRCVHLNNWSKFDDQFYSHFSKELLGNNITIIDWRDFVVQCLQLPYPNMEQLLFYRKLFQDFDIGDETITVENYSRTKLWFENEINQYNDAKWLLYDMYQVQNKLNYSAMLLAFCRDEKPWKGLEKSFSLIFNTNPTNLKLFQYYDYRYEESEIDVEDKNSVGSGDVLLPEEEIIFDKNLMTWFLMKNLKLYTNGEKQLGNINISQTVESVFEQIETKQVTATVSNLFRINAMDDLYNTVYKFQIKELSEVAKDIVMKYSLNI